MPFKCACFISYPHNAGKSVDKFVTRLKAELQDRFAQFVTDPVITDHDFKAGVDFTKRIAQTICESACLLVVYMPVYQRKAFCLQEYAAMELIQEQRFNTVPAGLSAKLGMILPLIYTGEETKIPKWIKDKINYNDISKYTISDPESVFDRPEFKQWLLDIADMVDSLYNEFQSAGATPCATCGKFSLPDANDPVVKGKLNIPVVPPEPFR